MRKLYIFLFLLNTIAASAQNWALLNPAYKYNYADDGTDTISDQLFVTSIDTLGVDSFHYALNPIGISCAPCIDAPVTCNSGAGLGIGRQQLFGLHATAAGTTWTLVGNDTLLVLADAPLDATWLGPSGIEATVSSVTEQLILGQPDSVKAIAFDNGASLIISKEHGIISYQDNGELYGLIGVQGGMDAGERFPTVIDFFNYQPGDILQYHRVSSWYDGFCYHQSITTTKYEVLARVDQPGRADYSVRRVFHSSSWSTGCGGGESSVIDTLALGVEHDRWTEDNFLGCSWLDHLWPQAFAPPLTTGGWSGDFCTPYYGIQWRGYLDDAGRYVVEPAQLLPGEGQPRPPVLACGEDSLYWPTDFGDMIGRYVEGIGRTYGKDFGFEHSIEEFLEGYIIGGVEYGTITPDDIILGMH